MIVDLAYPVADLVLLAMVIFVFVITARVPGRAWIVAGAAFGVITLADSLFLYLNATGGYAEGTMLDALWPGAMLLLAFAAWQPAKAGKAVALEGRFLATPLLCGIAALGVLVDEPVRARSTSSPASSRPRRSSRSSCAPDSACVTTRGCSRGRGRSRTPTS